MENLFFISFNIKTISGIDSYAKYNLGNNREKAEAIFHQLKGFPEFTNEMVLTMDFTEMKDGIPFPLKMLGCTFEEVVYNTRIITREIFKNLNLETD
jgi:hypothetical protein